MDEASSFYNFLVSADIPRLTIERDSGKCCPFLILPDSWEAYLTNLSANTRRNVRRYRRALEQKGSVSLEKVTDQVGLNKAFSDILRLRQDRMEQKGITTAGITSSYFDFHEKILSRFFGCGRLRLYFLKLNNQRIAYLYMYAGHCHVYAYQTGFDRSMANNSVGSVLFNMVIEQLIRERIAVFEFLRGNEKYKYLFGNIRESQLGNVIITRRTVSAILLLIKKKIFAKFKQLFRNLITFFEKVLSNTHLL
jgi:CelD/BcsL family acetyltransferase involved in cellulose biosynthesis